MRDAGGGREEGRKGGREEGREEEGGRRKTSIRDVDVLQMEEAADGCEGMGWYCGGIEVVVAGMVVGWW